MKTIKKLLRSPLATVALFLMAAGLLLTGSIGGTRAALTYFSETYTSHVELYNIGIGLVENGVRVDPDHILLRHLVPENERFQPGRAYTEELSVVNTGTIDQYVRVSIFKYWLDPEGKKTTTLSPALIDLHLVNGDTWLLDEGATTEERTVVYYNRILPADGVPTIPLTDTLTVDGSIANAVSQTVSTQGGQTVITTVYDYDGYRFAIEAQTDGVQTHNPEAAILSAWGVKATIHNGVLSLGQGG